MVLLMFTVIDNLEQLTIFLNEEGITRPDEILELLASENIIVAPAVADFVLEAA